MTISEIKSASVSVAGGIAGCEGLWRLERKHCTEQTAEELDKLLTSCKFFDTHNKDDLLIKYARDLRTTAVSVIKANGEQHAVTVLGLGDATNLTELITFIKTHGTEVFPGVSAVSSK
jgi:hypothetical protein